MIRIGAIGIDSSHLPEFTKRINTLNDRGETKCRVTTFWSDGRHDLPEDQVAKWRATTTSLGAAEAKSLEELLDNVDAVMVLAVNGNRLGEGDAIAATGESQLDITGLGAEFLLFDLG